MQLFFFFFVKTSEQNKIQLLHSDPASILYKSIAGRYRPVRVADGPLTARYRFIKNAYWGITKPWQIFINHYENKPIQVY